MASPKGKQKNIFRTPALLRLNSSGAPLTRRGDCPIWEWISQYFGLVILTLFPLFIGRRTYENITVTKFILFVALACLYIVLCLAVGILLPPGKSRGKLLRELPLQRPTAAQILMACYLLWGIVCTLASPYDELFIGQSRYEGLFSLLLYGIIFILLSFWGEYTDAYIYGLGGMATLLGLIAFAQCLGATTFYAKGDYYPGISFLTTIGHEDCVAGIICIAVPALLCGFVLLKDSWRYLGIPGLFFLSFTAVFTDVDTAKIGFVVVALMIPCLIESRERLQKLLWGFVPILAGFALAFTYRKWVGFAPTAAAAVFLAAALICALLGWYIGRRERVWRMKPATVRRAAYALMAVVLLVVIIFLYGYNGGSRLLREASELLHGHLSDEAGTYRGYIWKSTLKLIGERPVMGGGPGSFYSLFMPYNAGYQALINAEIVVDFPHNDFLSIAATTGIVGLVLYLAFLISLAVRCVRAARRSPILLVFIAGMLGYLVYSFFVFSIAIISPLFWVMAGVADKCVRQTQPEPQV